MVDDFCWESDLIDLQKLEKIITMENHIFVNGHKCFQ